jgi:hypothetical protein
MAELVLLVVAAAWAAVLIPPLLRSRIENRPNSSVTDFRNQLSSLQRTMPARSIGRGMARPLAPSPSPFARPAAAGRPAMRSGVRTHGSPASAAAGARTARNANFRQIETPRVRARSERNAAEVRSHRQTAARDLDGHDVVRRRRANVLFVLVLFAACSLFLAATTEVMAMLYVFALSFSALCGYVYLLGQYRQREQWAASADDPVVPLRPVDRRPARAPQPARREPIAPYRDRSYAV